jgi:hypothetical protein
LVLRYKNNEIRTNPSLVAADVADAVAMLAQVDAFDPTVWAVDREPPPESHKGPSPGLQSADDRRMI